MDGMVHDVFNQVDTSWEGKGGKSLVIKPTQNWFLRSPSKKVLSYKEIKFTNHGLPFFSNSGNLRFLFVFVEGLILGNSLFRVLFELFSQEAHASFQPSKRKNSTDYDKKKPKSSLRKHLPTFEPWKKLLLSIESWLFNKDPYNGLWNNPHITGQYNLLYTLANQGPFVHC